MRAAVLADFGSTICKVTVVDLDQGTLAGHGEAPTFLGPDVMEGHDAAYQAAIAHLPRRPQVAVRRSCSSAGGGLRMAAVGLVEDMTAAAARRAALNAGGRLELVLHGQIDDGDLAALDACDPEIVLFSGGTDGGQRELVLANARALSGGSWSGQVVVACNREAAAAAAATFRASGAAGDPRRLPPARHPRQEPQQPPRVPGISDNRHARSRPGRDPAARLRYAAR